MNAYARGLLLLLLTFSWWQIECVSSGSSPKSSVLRSLRDDDGGGTEDVSRDLLPVPALNSLFSISSSCILLCKEKIISWGVGDRDSGIGIITRLGLLTRIPTPPSAGTPYHIDNILN